MSTYIVANKAEYSYSAEGEVPNSQIILASRVNYDYSASAESSTTAAATSDPNKSTTFDCAAMDQHTEEIPQAVPEYAYGVTFTLGSNYVDAVAANYNYSASHKVVVISNVVEAGTADYAYGVKIYQAISTIAALSWVKWSDIGVLDFEIKKSNVAGERPLDWPGTIYDLIKHGSTIMCYGSNGVSILNPAGKFYGLTTINRVGVKNRNAVCGNDFIHFFCGEKNFLAIFIWNSSST